MPTALDCWSSSAGAGADDELVEQVLVRTNDRSEGSPIDRAFTGFKDSSAMQKRFQRLTRNVSEAIASIKNTLNLDSPRDPSPSKIESSRKVVWASVVRNLTIFYPGSQLPERLVNNIRKHYDSLPLSYARAGFDMKDVFLHMRLIEQASTGDQPAISIQEITADEFEGSVFKITFACSSLISLPGMSTALDSFSICCNKVQVFEKKGSTLGIVQVFVQDKHEKSIKTRIESALKLALKKPKLTSVKLPFGLCGCQEGNTNGREPGEIEEEINERCRNHTGTTSQNKKPQMPLLNSSFIVSVDEWQTIRSGREDLGKWLLNSDNLEFIDQIGIRSFKGVYKGKRVHIKKLKGCEKGNSYMFELHEHLLELMSSGQRNILQFHGVCIDDNHGLCIVSKFMEGGSVHDFLLKHKKLQSKEIFRIASDIAEGMKFVNDHNIVYRDLNTQRILLDRNGNACLADLGVVTACKNVGEAMEYEMDGYRWLAPEIIAGDPENVKETSMSNVYSFGMVVWEMVTGEAAYSSYSPVQAAVGIAACGLRPDIPKDCPQILKFLMTKCWNSCPLNRPQLSEIVSMLGGLVKHG